VHVHLPTKEVFRESYGRFGEGMHRYFRSELVDKTVDEVLADFDEAGVEKLVILGWDAETTTRLPRVPNDYIAKIVDAHPDRLIGFASVDPHKGALAVKELERAVKDLGLRGLKLHQVAQAFYPNDHEFYPLFEKAVELKIPVVFHMGMAAWGAGLPGGAGFRLKYSQPIFIDDLAADFPDLKILAAHPGWPWHDELLAIALHKPNVYFDLSGYAPKYIPANVLQYANTLLSDKCMFGSDYPHISPKRWVEEFKALNFKPESRDKILEKNARRFLGL